MALRIISSLGISGLMFERSRWAVGLMTACCANEAYSSSQSAVGSGAVSEMTLARAKAERQVFEVLTPEQRKQLAEMKSTGEPGRGRGDGPRGMGGEGRMPPPAR